DWIVTWSSPLAWWTDRGPSWTASVAMDLFLLVLLTRGFGQSALSVVSITLVGRSTGNRSGMIIGVYSFLTAVGFMAGFALVKFVMETWEPTWRELWAGIGWVVIAFGPLAWLLLRPSAAGKEQHLPVDCPPAGETSLTLAQALLSPAFWVFGI